ncbi:NACHT domain- and WD repeat-containing protein 1 [Periophthalmus magnuspinnatus]|uniref:NACHT domain- and WD repeat-containing protein 1 n=1 Tax=Periophthalmus magnuspinnatus TaxID=409849 RepID=UPI002436C8A8|nr:NACHT domain- and WD repeat-containing protein 1 [Periophthalmus magnuspinnatus]
MLRIFISSSFSDMSSERKTLLEKAYPEVLTYCRSLGLVFEVVDLRWGLRTSPSVEHDSCELFLHEIQTSKRISVIPAFVVLLGNRYGHRALPRLISEKHFEAFSSKLSKNTDGLKLLSQWYLKDANAVPPTYVLQPITAHLAHYRDYSPENALKREGDAAKWKSIETQLLTLLRNTATSAQSAGELHPEERQRYYTSDSSSLVFIREIPHQKVREGPKRFAKFMDLTADGLMDAEAQTLLTSLKARLYSGPQKILNLHCVELSKGAIDPKRKEHAQYLESLCEQFVSQVKTRIGAALDERPRRKIWGSVREETQKLDLTALTTEEVSRHVSASVELCKDFQGREGLLGKLCLTMWESTNERHAPIVVHGELGMGKTLLLCKLAQEMRSVLENRAAVVVRLLTLLHPQKYSVENMLRSLCCQICLAFGLAPPTSLTADAHLVSFFLNVLEQVSQQGNNLLLILDDVDRLADKNGKLRWLPYELPPNVHLVVSMETKSEAFARMRLRMETLENFFEVERLGAEDGEMMAESYLRSQNRTLAQEQKDFVLKSFEKSGSPLHLRLMLSLGKRWSSFTPLAELRLAASAQEMTSLLLHTMEERHGRELTAAALGYIALGREGLLECELRDVLSLDDDVIKEVYKHFLPPSPSLIRFPPLLWAGLKYDLTEHLTERWTNGIATIVFKNRRFSESVSSRYLTSDRKGRALKILAEFFLGRWSGKLKPVALPGLSLVLPDRKVPPQPLWFGAGLANVRKLQELPFHLLQAGLWEELKQEVISNAEWLFCKSRVCGVQAVVQDLDQSWRIMDCVETKLIRDVLILIKPSLDYLDGNMEMTLFYSELLSRLRSLAPLYPALIGQLCSQCETWLLSCTEPILIPQTSFLQPPGGALTHTLTGLQGGVLCLDVRVEEFFQLFSVPAGVLCLDVCVEEFFQLFSVPADVCVEEELVVAGSDDGVIGVWSIPDAQLLHTLLGHTGAVLVVRVTGSALCVSLAADGSMRKWDLLRGKQEASADEVLATDRGPVRLSVCERRGLLTVHTETQVKFFGLDGFSLLSSISDPDSQILGVLDDSVVSLCGPGLVQISQALDRTKDPVMVRLQEQEANQNQTQDQTQAPNPDCPQAPGRTLTLCSSVALSRRQKVLVVFNEGILFQISKDGGHTSKKFPLTPSVFNVSHDEKILLAGSDLVLVLFRLDGVDRFLDRFLELVHDDEVLSACVSSDSRMLFSGAKDQIIRVWSITTGALLDSLCGLDAPVSSLSLLSDLIVSASSSSTAVKLWTLRYDTRHKPPAHIPTGSAHSALTRDCDQVFYVQNQGHHEVLSWSPDTGGVSERMAVSVEVSCLEVAQSKRLLLCGLLSGTVFIYPLTQPEETLCIPPPESLSRVRALTLSPSERLLGVAYDDQLCLFTLTSRDCFPAVQGPDSRLLLGLLHGPLTCCGLLNDQRFIYGTSCGEVRLHDFRSGSGSVLEAHRSRVSCVTVSNWESHALIGSDDTTQRLYSLRPTRLQHSMDYKGFFFEGVLCAAFSDSDQFVFTGSRDRTIKVWGVSTGKLLLVQFVYFPVVRMVTYRNGFVALSKQGTIIRETFRCPDHISPDYNPLRTVRAQYRVTSNPDDPRDPCGAEEQGRSHSTQGAELHEFNPAHLSLMDVMKSKPSPTCVLL